MPAPIKVEHLNPFIQSTVQTFATMMKAEIKPGKVKLMDQDPMHYDVSAIIGLTGGAKGCVAICFPRLTALKTLTAFIGERVLSLDKDALDAIGEIANIVVGNAKKDLEAFQIHISLPTVVMGDGHAVVMARDIPQLRVPFESLLGPFEIKVAFKSESEGA